MGAPDDKSRLQLLEKLDGPGSGPPWKWIAMGAGGAVLVGGVILLIVLGGSKKGARKGSSTADATMESGPEVGSPLKEAGPGESLITGSRARPVAGGMAGSMAGGMARQGAGTKAGGPAASAAPERMADGMMRYRGKVTAGTALITILKGAGASTGHALGLLKALGEHFNLRRSRPGHKYELHVDPAKRRPVFFRYQVSLARVYEVRWEGHHFEAKPVKVAVTRKQVSYAGMVAASLGGELAARGAHPALLAAIISVLTSMPKFFKAQRFGDRFRVLVEEELVEGRHLRFGPVLALEYISAKGKALRLYHYRMGKGPGKYYTDKGVSLPTARLHIPVHYTRISSPFGMRFHPVLKRRKLHSGVDFVAPAGTTVRSCLEGKVIYAARRGAFGNLVVLDHGGGLQSYYAHLLRFRRGLKRGDKVRARFAIGYVGSTGRSTGPHLHFGLKLAGKWIDPLTYRMRPGQPAPGGHRGRLMGLIAKRKRILRNTPLLGAFRLPARISSGDEVVTGVEEH